MTLPQTMISWLGSIPDVVWAALMGSALTLLGVFVQLLHQGRQRNRDRELNLRRDVYLPAAESLTVALDYIAKLPNTNPDEQEMMEGVPSLMNAVAKINIIGSDETLARTNVLLSKYSSVVIQLMSKKTPLVKLRWEIDTLQKIVKDCQARQEAALTDMRALNFSKETDQGLWKLVNSQFERAQDDGAKYQRELDQKWDQWMKLTCDMIAESIEASKEIQGLVLPVLLAIRKELRLPLDEQQYLKVMEELNKNAQASFDEFLAKIRTDAGTPKNEIA